MAFRAVAAVSLFLSIAPAFASRADPLAATPIGKVVVLLKGLEEKVTAEGKEEAAAYDKYSCFCKEQADEKLYSIEKSNALIKKLTASIEKLGSEISKLDGDIGKLAGEIGDLDDKMTAEQDKRDKEHAAYEEEAEDLKQALDACERALEAIKSSKGDLKDAKTTGLLELRSKLQHVSANARVPLAASELIQQLTGEDQPKYAFQANHIIVMLEDLVKEFKEMQKDMDEEEFEIQSIFDKEQLSRANKKKFAEKEKDEKERVSSAKSEEKNEAMEQKDEEIADKDADQKFLDVLTDNCQSKAELWDQRSQTRSGELKALADAIRELESGAMENYKANEKLVGLAQLKPINLLQLQRSTSQGVVMEKLENFLQEKAEALKSASLAGLAARASVAEDHFVKVRGLIKDLLKKLEEDAASEATQKSFCDKGMKEALAQRDSSASKEEGAEGALAKLTAKKETLENEIVELNKGVAENNKALKEATELRKEAKDKNENTIKMAEDGKKATDLALSILNKFYSTALMQNDKFVPKNSDRDGNTVGDLAPETFDDSYHGSKSESKGIIGILEVISSDFERTISTTTDDEQGEQLEFDKFEDTNKKSTSQKQKDIKTKEGMVTTAEDDILKRETDLKDAQDMHEDALGKLKDLKTMCVDGEESFEDRAEKRKQEVEALKEAMTILEDWQG